MDLGQKRLKKKKKQVLSIYNNQINKISGANIFSCIQYRALFTHYFDGPWITLRLHTGARLHARSSAKFPHANVEPGSPRVSVTRFAIFKSPPFESHAARKKIAFEIQD